MASPFLYLLILSLSSTALLEANADTAATASSNTTHLHFYLHDTVSGSNPTAVQVTTGPTKLKGTAPGPYGFGSMFMIDDPLTEGPNLTSTIIGRAQGFYAYSGLSGTELLFSANIVLTGGDYNGSTVTVFGRDNFADTVRELSVIGGSGKFRMARGYMLIKTSTVNLATADAVLDVDLYMSNGDAVIDESVPSSAGSTSAGGATPSTSSKTTDASSSASILQCTNYVATLVVSCFLAKHLIWGI